VPLGLEAKAYPSLLPFDHRPGPLQNRDRERKRLAPKDANDRENEERCTDEHRFGTAGGQPCCHADQAG
jgi:hypothetical protein